MILVDDSHAVMEPADFEALLEYNRTLPTGTTCGKRWKCRVGYSAWVMGEYGVPGVDHLGRGFVPIRWREIIVLQ